MTFNQYTFEHRGYRFTFSEDEKAAEITLAGVKDGDVLYVAKEHDELVWDGDDATQSTVTALVDAIRWTNADIKARKEAALNPPPAAELPATPIQPTPVVVDSPLPVEPTPPATEESI
jgi:hypothetical protein